MMSRAAEIGAARVAPDQTRFPWRTLAAVALALIAFVISLFWFRRDYGAELRKAAYSGDVATVKRVLREHPNVIDSYITHPEMLDYVNPTNNLAGFMLRRAAIGLRHFLWEKVRRHSRSQYDVWNESGYSALDLAVWGNHPEIVCLLLDHHADTAHLNAGNMGAFHQAAQYGNLEAVKCFVAHNAGLDDKDRMGCVPLCWATLNQRADIAELLLTHGAKADGCGDMTPLHWAVEVKSESLAELLLRHGAQVNLKDRANRTALSIAVKKGDKEMAAFLREHGATD